MCHRNTDNHLDVPPGPDGLTCDGETVVSLQRGIRANLLETPSWAWFLSELQ
jgi:hypothetical protein